MQDRLSHDLWIDESLMPKEREVLPVLDHALQDFGIPANAELGSRRTEPNIRDPHPGTLELHCEHACQIQDPSLRCAVPSLVGTRIVGIVRADEDEISATAFDHRGQQSARERRQHEL